MHSLALLLLLDSSCGILIDPFRAQKRAEERFAEGLREPDEAKARACFQEAADEYQTIADQWGGLADVPLYLNLGNARFLAGEIPAAILAYRKGLHQSPGDANLCIALAAARDRVYRGEAAFLRPPDPKPPLVYLSPIVRLCTGWFFLAICWVSLARWLMVRRKRWGWLGLLAFPVALGFTLSWFADWREHDDFVEHPPLVIARDGAVLRRGNGLVYPPHDSVRSLPAGVEGRQLTARDGWVQIELTGGITGWAQSEDVLRN